MRICPGATRSAAATSAMPAPVSRLLETTRAGRPSARWKIRAHAGEFATSACHALKPGASIMKVSISKRPGRRAPRGPRKTAFLRASAEPAILRLWRRGSRAGHAGAWTVVQAGDRPYQDPGPDRDGHPDSRAGPVLGWAPALWVPAGRRRAAPE